MAVAAMAAAAMDEAAMAAAAMAVATMVVAALAATSSRCRHPGLAILVSFSWPGKIAL